MSRLKNIDRRWIWIALGVLMILLRMVLSFFPQFVESVYSRGIFKVIRYVQDFTISLSRVPLIYIFILLFVVWRIYAFRKNRGKLTTFKAKTINFLFSVSAFLGALIFLFILLWGFNYGRIPLENQLQINPQRLSDEELKAEFQRASFVLFENYSNFQLSKKGKEYDLDRSGKQNEI